MTACERFGKVMQFASGALALALICSAYRYPFFIEAAKEAGVWVIKNPPSLEGNLLVFASILIGVAVIQAQNLNRMKEILRSMGMRQKGGLSGFFDSKPIRQLVEKWGEEERWDGDKIAQAVEGVVKAADEYRRAGKSVVEDRKSALAIYEFLLRGFWLLSLAIVVVLLTLGFSVLAGTAFSSLTAFILSTGWWATIWLVLISWACLATVAWRSYMNVD